MRYCVACSRVVSFWIGFLAVPILELIMVLPACLLVPVLVGRVRLGVVAVSVIAMRGGPLHMGAYIH